MITPPLNIILQCGIFFPATFLYFWVMCLFSLNCSDSMKCLCTPLRLKKKKKKEVRFWEIHHFLPGTCGCEDGSCLLTTWESEKCLRTVIRQWDSGRRGQSIWGQVHREDPSQQIIPKCISRMNFLFLPSFVINYFSFSMEKKSEKFILCLSIFYLIT